jgi:hypothetical protein
VKAHRGGATVAGAPRALYRTGRRTTIDRTPHGGPWDPFDASACASTIYYGSMSIAASRARHRHRITTKLTKLTKGNTST